MSRVFLTVAAALSCLLMASCGSSAPPPRSSSGGQARQIGAAGNASLFRLPDTTGRTVTVKTPTALFFFTSWCGYCKQAMPEINRLTEVALQRGWRVYGIDVKEGLAQMEAFIRDYRPNFPVLLDTQGTIASQYGVTGYPTFVLIDENANIVYKGHAVPKGF